ncbi:MAG: hypothetical protein K2W84_17230 [Burkholderiales bacterium]|nr:hypothetical protein [Burkholderiales bacterium]
MTGLRQQRASATLLFALLLAGCAGKGLFSGGTAAPEAPVVNLSGYSASYKKGHADGCAKRRDERLYREQGDYMMGWNDGSVACKRR